MKAINIIFVMLAVNSGVLSSAQEQNQGEIEPQEANEQRALPVDVEIDGVGRVLKNYQQLFDTNELEDETEDGDVSIIL